MCEMWLIDNFHWYDVKIWIFYDECINWCNCWIEYDMILIWYWMNYWYDIMVIMVICLKYELYDLNSDMIYDYEDDNWIYEIYWLYVVFIGYWIIMICIFIYVVNLNDLILWLLVYVII